MKKTVKEQIEVEINEILQNMKSEEYDTKNINDDLSRLSKFLEVYDNIIKTETIERSSKLDRVESIRKNVEVGLKGVSIIGGLALNATWLAKGFKFEETGVLTSSVFKTFIGNMLRTKDVI